VFVLIDNCIKTGGFGEVVAKAGDQNTLTRTHAPKTSQCPLFETIIEIDEEVAAKDVVELTKLFEILGKEIFGLKIDELFHKILDRKPFLAWLEKGILILLRHALHGSLIINTPLRLLYSRLIDIDSEDREAGHTVFEQKHRKRIGLLSVGTGNGEDLEAECGTAAKILEQKCEILLFAKEVALGYHQFLDEIAQHRSALDTLHELVARIYPLRLHEPQNLDGKEVSLVVESDTGAFMKDAVQPLDTSHARNRRILSMIDARSIFLATPLSIATRGIP